MLGPVAQVDFTSDSGWYYGRDLND